MPDPQDWAGPLFYPPVGSVAVMGSGTRIKVWPSENDDPDSFTGINLSDGDASCMWDRIQIAAIEAPSAADHHPTEAAIEFMFDLTRQPEATTE